MGADGLAAVQMRIAELRTQFGGFSAPRAPEAAATSASFARALDAAVGASGTSGFQDPATALAGYENGRLPSELLSPISNGSERMWTPAARAFNQMSEAAWRSGIRLEVNDGYRPLADQQRLASELGLYRDGGKAAVPGTSTHGLGLSVDVDTDGGAGEWLRANAARFGFAADVPGEPWHWTWGPKLSS